MDIDEVAACPHLRRVAFGIFIHVGAGVRVEEAAGIVAFELGGEA